MLKLIKNFPVPSVGVVASVLVVVAQALAGSPSWSAAVPAVAAALGALFVTPSYRVSSNNYVVKPASREGGYSDVGLIVLAVVAVVIVLILVGRL